MSQVVAKVANSFKMLSGVSSFKYKLKDWPQQWNGTQVERMHVRLHALV